MPLPRRKRKVRTHNRTTATSSAGTDGTFLAALRVEAKTVVSNRKYWAIKNAIPVMSLCSVDELVQELERTNGNTDKLERAVTESAKQMQRKDCNSYIELTYRQIMASVLQSSTFLERMKKGSQSLFTPDVWNFSMVHFNAYEEGVRYEDLFFRSCSNTNCLSTYIKGEQPFRMCECPQCRRREKDFNFRQERIKTCKIFRKASLSSCASFRISTRFCMKPTKRSPCNSRNFRR